MSGSAKGSEGGASGSKGSDSAKGYVSASGKERTLRTGAHPSMGSGKKMGKKVCISSIGLCRVLLRNFSLPHTHAHKRSSPCYSPAFITREATVETREVRSAHFLDFPNGDFKRFPCNTTYVLQ
jgi:hypothetical protein